MSFLHRNRRSVYTIIFDIASSSVGVAIVKNEKHATPVHILFSHRVPIHFDTKKDIRIPSTALTKAIKLAGEEALEALGTLAGRNKTYTLQAITHSPWSRSQSKTIKGKLQKEMVVTKDMITHFIKKHVEKTKPEEDYKEINTHITQIALNGYPTAHPYNKKAHTIETTSLTHHMKKFIYEEIISAFNDVFPHHTVHLDSLIFVALTLKDVFVQTEDFTLIDIGGNHSAVNIISGATVRRSESFDFGTQRLMDALMTNGNMEKEHASSELEMFLEDTCTPAQCSKIETLLKDSEERFVKMFGDTCTQLNKTYRLPTRTFVLIAPRYAKWFATIIGRLDFSQFTITGHSLEVSAVTPENNTRVVLFTHTRQHHKDSALALDALFTSAKHQDT